MNNAVILYDIPGTATVDRSWSPNVWKTRFVLNYKGINHRSSWINYPEIMPLCTEFNVPPSAIRRNGSPHYTVPFIYDPHTSTYVSDSLLIAHHLESSYPDSPSLFPMGFEAAIHAFDHMWQDYVLQHIFPLMVYPVYEQLMEASKDYFRITREARYKARIEEIAPLEKHSILWDRVYAGLGKVDAYMRANGGGATFWFGTQLTYADVTMAGWLVWVKRILGKESEEWCKIVSWHDGRWGRLMKEFEKWEYVDSPKAR